MIAARNQCRFGSLSKSLFALFFCPAALAVIMEHGFRFSQRMSTELFWWSELQGPIPFPRVRAFYGQRWWTEYPALWDKTNSGIRKSLHRNYCAHECFLSILMLAGTEVLSLGANQKDSGLRERDWQEAGVNTFKQQKYIILTICICSTGIVEHFYCTFSGLLWKRKSI